MKKFIIGLFAAIGVLSVLACLVGIGYLAGSSTSIPELLNLAKPATGSPEVSTENTETLNENATGNTDLGTITSADRGASQGNIVSNITPTPSVSNPTETPTTPTETPTNQVDDLAFNPSNIVIKDNKVTLGIDLIEGTQELPQFKDFTQAEVETFLENIANELAGQETSQDIYDTINRYDDPAILNYLTGHYLTERPATPTPTPSITPSAEELTFTYFENPYEDTRYALTEINVWSEPTDYGKKIGSIKPYNYIVVIHGQCNETGYYKIEYGLMQNGRVDDIYEGYIHPHHFQYLTNAEMEQAKQEAQEKEPAGVPLTPAPIAPTEAPTPAPTEAPTQSEQAKPTATPSEKPTATPTAKPTQKPTETASKTLTFIKTDDQGNVYTESIETTGTYITNKKGTFYVPDGLENSEDLILLDSIYEACAWQDKYSNAFFSTYLTTDSNGNEVTKYLLDINYDTSGPLGISQELANKLINSGFHFWDE